MTLSRTLTEEHQLDSYSAVFRNGKHRVVVSRGDARGEHEGVGGERSVALKAIAALGAAPAVEAPKDAPAEPEQPPTAEPDPAAALAAAEAAAAEKADEESDASGEKADEPSPETADAPPATAPDPVAPQGRRPR